MQTLIAIDPGASGGIAVKYGEQRPYVVPMPENDGDLIEFIRNVKLSAEGANQEFCAVMERVGGFIAGNPAPGSAMFNFGRGVGFIEGVLRATGWRLEFVRPQEWQKSVGAGSRDGRTAPQWKRHLRDIACRLYPELKITLKTCDALLIMEHASK
jgi:hypothetical protein